MSTAREGLLSLIPEDSPILSEFHLTLLREYCDSELGIILDIAEASKAKIENLPSFSRPLWISSAGGLACGKSTALLRFTARLFGREKAVSKKEWRQPGLAAAIDTIFGDPRAAFVSPDLCGLRDIWETSGECERIDEAFYRKWRNATVFLARLDLGLAAAGMKNIVHDTTLSGENYLPNARLYDYYVTVATTACPPGLRQAAASARNAAFFQSAPEDIAAKDRAFGRQLPLIAGDADEMHILWRNNNFEEAGAIAFVKDARQIAIYDPVAFNSYCALYPWIGHMANSAPCRNDRITSQIVDILEKQTVRILRPSEAIALAPT